CHRVPVGDIDIGPRRVRVLHGIVVARRLRAGRPAQRSTAGAAVGPGDVCGGAGGVADRQAAALVLQSADLPGGVARHGCGDVHLVPAGEPDAARQHLGPACSAQLTVNRSRPSLSIQSMTWRLMALTLFVSRMSPKAASSSPEMRLITRKWRFTQPNT